MLGFGDSKQKYLYISEPHNDFIFAVLAEELGFIGCLGVIILFAVFILLFILDFLVFPVVPDILDLLVYINL